MPIYEYRCKNCEFQFDVLQKIGADGKDLNCPECGAPFPEKILSTFASAGSDSGQSLGGCLPGKGFT
ncbi:MAG: FmdB family zinc ribbon protein [bacterium]